MAYHLKKDHVTNWNAHESNGKPAFNDDQDTYISERSSTASLGRSTPRPGPNNKQLSPPVLPKNEPNTLRYHYNELPENGVPLAIQASNIRKEEKERRRNIRKAPPGQGSLVPPPETRPPETGDSYYPYWYYYKMKNPDWIKRHRQTTDGQLIPYEYVDPSQYVHEPALTNTSIKPRRHHRKSDRYDPSNMQYNPDKQRNETTQRTSPSSHLISRENYDQQRLSSKNSDRTNIHTRSQKRVKLKTENDWNDHYNQTLINKSSRDSHNRPTTNGTSTHRSKHRSKKINNILPDENRNHHHHHHHHHHQQTPPESQNHHHHHHHHSSSESRHRHHHHHHHNHHLPFEEYIDTEFQVIDASFKKSERTPFFQQTQNSYHVPPPAIYDQNSYLPPITRDYYHRPYSIDYYGTQTLSTDWRGSIKSPKIYKPKPETKFYDRYLNNVIDKRLTTS